MTRAISRLRVGESVGDARALWQRLALATHPRAMTSCIVTGGIGLAPLRPVIYDIIRHRTDFGRVFLLYGARTPGDMLYTSEFEAWEEQGIQVRHDGRPGG